MPEDKESTALRIMEPNRELGCQRKPSGYPFDDIRQSRLHLCHLDNILAIKNDDIIHQYHYTTSTVNDQEVLLHQNNIL
jgi:hypothetical protein